MQGQKNRRNNYKTGPKCKRSKISNFDFFYGFRLFLSKLRSEECFILFLYEPISLFGAFSLYSKMNTLEMLSPNKYPLISNVNAFSGTHYAS